jgi:hypothetical protein
MDGIRESNRLLPDRWAESSMVAYLLGQLPQDSAAELEDAFFADEELFAALRSVETELIHAYLRGGLTGARLQRFEEVYAGSTAGGRRLEAEREWFEAAKLVDEGKRTGGVELRDRWWRGFFSDGSAAMKFAAVLVCLAGALVFGWLVHRVAGIEAEVRGLRAGLSAPASAPQLVASFVLAPGLTRGEGAQKRIVLPGNAGQVRFELELEGVPRHDAYHAVLQVVDGYEVWSGRVSSEGSTVSAIMPASVLSRNDYKLTLEGTGPHAEAVSPSYLFSVVGR